ncbi:MAG: AAA family ATPase, partial [Acinetobacter sp.]
MKILSIRIKNLASLAGEHFIDFESEPLASAGLIAIIGKTGAGKSTILDAMCLALFNQVPRLKGSDGKLVDVDGSELLSNSPLTVLRRGTGHGFAELCFVAQDQKHYLARWEIKRARENAAGKLQNVQRSLTCLTDGVVVADKAKAVDLSIHKITQLSFEQFTRAVLLAQSEVTAFLKARDNERGALLEYLTNSNIFAKIGEIAFRKTADIEKERKKLEDVLGHIEILSDEAIAELNQQFTIANIEYKKLETEKTDLSKQQLWFEEHQKLENQISDKQKNYDHQFFIQQQLAAERQKLSRLEVFSSIRPTVFQQAQLVKAQQQLAPDIQQLQNSFTVVSKQFYNEEQHYKKAD